MRWIGKIRKSSKSTLSDLIANYNDWCHSLGTASSLPQSLVKVLQLQAVCWPAALVKLLNYGKIITAIEGRSCEKQNQNND